MNKSLYNIEQEYIQLADQLIESGGEVTEEIETALAINREQLEQKGAAYGCVIKQMEYEVDVIDQEIARLSAMKKSRQKSAERLKETVKQAMVLYGITEIKTPTMKLSFRKSESVQVDDIKLLPPAYITVKTTEMPDKTAIKDAIKAGAEIPGASLQVNQNLQIK